MLAEGEEIASDEADLWYLRRLDGGFFTLQSVDYILAWVAMEDDGVSRTSTTTLIHADSHARQARSHMVQMLKRKDKSLASIVGTLRIYQDNVDEVPLSEEHTDAPTQKQILEGLIAFLESC